MKKIFYILLFVVSCLFYWGTSHYIQNRTEAEDAFEYATMVESTGHPWLYHPHHLLYGPTMKLVYKTFQVTGYTGRALGVMMLVSSISAAGSLFFFFLFCYKRFSLRPVSSLMATGLLAVSYGFWRYAAEAEIVLPASLLILIALYYGTDAEAKYSSSVLTVIFSVLSVLMHIMNGVAVFIAIPCFYLLRRRWKAAALHVLFCAGLTALVFWLTMRIHPLYAGGGAHFIPVGLGSLVKAMVALSQCIASADFVLGLRSMRAFLGELFASRMLQEEFYLGARLSRAFVLFSMLTYLLFTGLWVACLARAAWIWKNRALQRDRFQLPAGIATLIVAAVWFFGYTGLLLCVEPGNPELWVMGLVPLWLLFCGWVLLPLTFDNRLWLPFAMLLILLIHNGVGGIGVLGDPSKDYQRQKAKWILENASARDLVITAGDPVFERYLRYHFHGEVVYLYAMPPEQLEAGYLPHSDGEVYVTADVFTPIRSLLVRFPKKSREIAHYSGLLRPQVRLTAQDAFGGVYRLEESGSDD